MAEQSIDIACKFYCNSVKFAFKRNSEISYFPIRGCLINGLFYTVTTILLLFQNLNWKESILAEQSIGIACKVCCDSVKFAFKRKREIAYFPTYFLL